MSLCYVFCGTKNRPYLSMALLSLPLLIIFLALVHHAVGLAEVLYQDPSHASARPIWEGFVLGLHAGAPNGVGVLAFYSGDVVVTGHRLLDPLVIDIVATGVTVTEVHVLFDGVGIREAVAAAAWRATWWAALLAALLAALVVAVSWLVVLLVAVARLVAVVVATSRLLVVGDVGAHSKRAAAMATIAACVVPSLLALVLGTGAAVLLLRWLLATTPLLLGRWEHNGGRWCWILEGWCLRCEIGRIGGIRLVAEFQQGKSALELTNFGFGRSRPFCIFHNALC
jgi:hypothetical protein